MTAIKYKSSEEIGSLIESEIRIRHIDQVFILVDNTTNMLCLSKINTANISPTIITLDLNEQSKDLDHVVQLWDIFMENMATRHSLLINVGGGLICDIGGFAAATYKRGMHFINIPTTLLATIDAATGGKNGINYRGVKNMIGTFVPADLIIINPTFFETLDTENRLSGYAEMIKHSLIGDNILFEQTMSYDIEKFDIKRLSLLLKQNLDLKQRITENDPLDNGIRKSLNFGHTIGHALEAESISKGKTILHGYAVMWGMLAEIYLSVIKLKFDKSVLHTMMSFAKEHYGSFPFTCKEYEDIYNYMKHDKKNSGDEINFSLLAGIGDVRLNQSATKEEIFEALDYIREN